MITKEQIQKQNQLKIDKPHVYEKCMRYPEKVARGESIAIIQFAYKYICNFSCKHCSIKRLQGNRDSRQFTIPDVKRLSKQADELGLAHFVITGGEPTIFSDLDELIDAIDPNKFHIAMDTNGYLLDDKMAKHLKEKGIDRLQLSLDSLSFLAHDDLRQKQGSQKRAFKAIDACQNTGLNCMIATVVTKQRVRSREFIFFLETMGIKNVPVFVTFAKPTGAWEGNFDIMVDKSDMEYVDNLRKDFNVFTHLTPAYGFNFGCIAIKRMVSITSAGEVLVCPYIHTTLGNVFKEPLKDILERGMKLKPFKNVNTCLIAEDKEFVNKYVVNKIYNKPIPVDCNEVFNKEDWE